MVIPYPLAYRGRQAGAFESLLRKIHTLHQYQNDSARLVPTSQKLLACRKSCSSASRTQDDPQSQIPSSKGDARGLWLSTRSCRAYERS
jgi:hypothetical protein